MVCPPVPCVSVHNDCFRMQTFVHISFHQYLPIHLSLLIVNLSVQSPVPLFLYPSVCRIVLHSIHPSVHPSLPPIHPSIHFPSIHPSVRPSPFHPVSRLASVKLFSTPSIHPSICPSCQPSCCCRVVTHPCLRPCKSSSPFLKAYKPFIQYTFTTVTVHLITHTDILPTSLSPSDVVDSHAFPAIHILVFSVFILRTP